MLMNEICPVCGGPTVLKKVTEIIRGGKHTAIIQVEAEVCLHCGERLYTPEFVRKCEQIKAKLEKEETKDFQPVGVAYQA